MIYASNLAFISAFISGVLALAVAWRERRSLAHWAFILGMLALAVGNLFYGFALDSVEPEKMVIWQSRELVALAFLPGTWLLFSLTYARGNYREFLKRWNFALVCAFLLPVGLALLFQDEIIISVGQSAGNQHRILGLGFAGLLLNLLLLLSAVLVLMNLERTYRASVGTMRWRIKFMVLGLGVIFAVQAYTSSQVMLFRAIDLSLPLVNSGALLVGCMLILRSLLRQGHFNLDVYPSHSVLHNSLTVLLAGIYLLIVGLFAKLVAILGGDASFTAKAFVVLVALVLLSVLLLSDRVRLRTRQFVSRHFQRPLYDYRTLWRRFTEGTASCVKEVELCQAGVKLVTDIFQVLSVTIWTLDDKKQNLVFAASTFLSSTRANELQPESASVAELLAAFSERPDPVDIDAAKTHWAVALRRCHPEEFHKGGNRVCVPMLVGGELLGVMLLGDRVSGVPFSTQDFDLLKCVGDQMAASLLNIQLSHRLMQAREMEAFQTMSAFFVHDLKNTASTLSLMLQNLPAHYNDPAFREDALRGITKAVQHINDIIRRLTLLRRETAVGLVESDLNALIARVLAEQDLTPNIRIVQELGALPKQPLDTEQMQKVVTNLVLNAREAIRQDGEIRVTTVKQNGWAVLSVSDTGSGMSRDFVQRSLFRPFQTTKKNGIGIGMFQSKLIVEAHHGKIEVETEPGKGTTFRVLLPLTSKAN